MNARNLFWNCEEWIFGHCKNGLENPSLSDPEESVLNSRPRINGNGEWDIICENCDSPLEIFQRKCPVCLSNSLMNPEIAYYEVDSLGIHNYVCEDCGRKLYRYTLFEEKK